MNNKKDILDDMAAQAKNDERLRKYGFWGIAAYPTAAVHLSPAAFKELSGGEFSRQPFLDGTDELFFTHNAIKFFTLKEVGDE